MFRVRKIDSFDLPELAPYRTMRRQLEQREQGFFVAEGEKVVRRLLESRFTVISALMPEKWLQELQPLLAARAEEVQVFVADKSLLETLTGFSMYQGLLAIGKIPCPPTWEQMLAAGGKPRLIAAVDGLSSAENLGSLVRNCTAFAVQALIVGETSTSPYLRRAVRSSMGTVFQLPIVELTGPERRFGRARGSGEPVKPMPGTLIAALGFLRENGICCIAAHPHVSEQVLACCDDSVAIPMPPTVDSLNVGSAAAVFLYEASRQRTTRL
jgi:tRNA G18 (ribose-2'-O)-methylase SpoU